MKLVKAIIRPNKLEEVKDALTRLNVTGMTVSEVRGHGRQKGHKAIYRGTEYSVTLLPKIMIELVIPDELVDDTIKTIIETAKTGEIGDGRVFVLPLEQGYNIRTGERDVPLVFRAHPVQRVRFKCRNTKRTRTDADAAEWRPLLSSSCIPATSR